MASKTHGIFSISRRGGNKGEGGEHEMRKKRSLSTPYDLDLVEKFAEHVRTDGGTKKVSGRKKSGILSRLLRKGDTHTTENTQQEGGSTDSLNLKQDLDFAHALMVDPAEMDTDLCRVDSEPDLVQTVCAPHHFSKATIKLDKKIHQIYIANNRIATLSSLSGTAILGKDYMALNFLQDYLNRIRTQRSTLFQQVDEQLTKFKLHPETIMAAGPRSPGGKEDQVTFTIQDEDTDTDDIHWEAQSLGPSADNTSEESDGEGPTPAEVENIAKQIRKSESTRFKHRKRWKKRSVTNLQPPPPNPLGNANRALMRSHTTVPSGLCQRGNASMTSLHSEADSLNSNRAQKAAGSNANLPFNLLSLTGQLSWLVSEYIERDTPTYRWATDLINQISRMCVTRATWLNVHQQLRETTELLYKHRGRNRPASSESAKGDVAWRHLQSIYQSVRMKDSNSETVTVGRATQILNSSINEMNTKLVHLSALLNTKFHLAYICDLVLWRAHKVLFNKLAEAPDDTASHQLIDFRIRHMQLRLDQANNQNWSPAVIDWILCWIYQAISPGQHVRKTEEDNYCLNELMTLKKSIRQFQVLTKHLCDSEFLSEQYLCPHDEAGSSAHHLEGSQHHLHYHPHLNHHGEIGHFQDLRPLDADRCSHTYSALVRSVHEHAMADRPLSYFAQRALYDISMELDCQVNWEARIKETLDELLEAYHGWEEMLMARLDLDFYQKLFEADKNV